METKEGYEDDEDAAYNIAQRALKSSDRKTQFLAKKIVILSPRSRTLGEATPMLNNYLQSRKLRGQLEQSQNKQAQFMDPYIKKCLKACYKNLAKETPDVTLGMLQDYMKNVDFPNTMACLLPDELPDDTILTWSWLLRTAEYKYQGLEAEQLVNLQGTLSIACERLIENVFSQCYGYKETPDLPSDVFAVEFCARLNRNSSFSRFSSYPVYSNGNLKLEYVQDAYALVFAQASEFMYPSGVGGCRKVLAKLRVLSSSKEKDHAHHLDEHIDLRDGFEKRDENQTGFVSVREAHAILKEANITTITENWLARFVRPKMGVDYYALLCLGLKLPLSFREKPEPITRGALHNISLPELNNTCPNRYNEDSRRYSFDVLRYTRGISLKQARLMLRMIETFPGGPIKYVQKVEDLVKE